MSEGAPRHKAGEQIGERYVLEKCLGAGAFGEVWSATDARAFKKLVAIKFLHEEHETNAEVVQRFIREGQATAQLSHPNVVALLDFSPDPRNLYLVSEYVAGDPLRKVLNRHIEQKRMLTPAEVLAIFRQLCQGVSAAHAKGIVHRDLKPENVMVVGDGMGVHAKVLDFGVARIIERSGPAKNTAQGRTAMGKVIGSLQYMSPEQVTGDTRTLDHRADVFALGAILFELLTLQPAFQGESYPMIVAGILANERPKVSLHRPDLPVDLDRIIARAFEVYPKDRYQTVAELFAELEPLLSAASAATAVYADAAAANKAATTIGGQRKSAGPEDPAHVATVVPKGVVDPALAATMVGERVVPEQKSEVRTSVPWEQTQGGAAATTQTTTTQNTAAPVTPPASGLAGWAVAVFAIAITVGVIGAVAVRARRTPVVPPPSIPDAQVIVIVRTPDAAAPVVQDDPSWWVTIPAPAAPFVLGRTDEREGNSGFLPRANVRFTGPAFQLMKREVTWGVFEPWARGREDRAVTPPAWVPQTSEARVNLPVVAVPWQVAVAFCRELHGDLPSEEQWEFALRGAARRADPWPPNTAVNTLAIYRGPTGTLAPVGSIAADQTPEGIQDLGGNALEWTSSMHRDDDGTQPDWTRRYRTVRGLPLRIDPPAQPAHAGVFRNPGCFVDGCYSEDRGTLESVGFRCARPVQ